VRLLGAFIGMIILILLGAALIIHNREPRSAHGLNVLVVSLCSDRPQTLSPYGGRDTEVMPAAEAFFRDGSFVFGNAFNGMPWIGIRSFVEKFISRGWLTEHGYAGLGSHRGVLFRVPNVKNTPDSLGDDQTENDRKKYYAEDMQKLKDRILSPRENPFFVVAHIKYLHYPLVDKFNPDSGWDRYLDDGQKKHVEDMRADPGKYADKVPLLILLFDDPKMISANPRIQGFIKQKHVSSSEDLLGLVNDPGLIADWKRSPGYENDLQILNKVYAANQHYADQITAPLLNLFGDEELKKNTLVVYIGDHGELHMEHDLLTHGTAIYDDSLRVPLAIRFPGRGPARVIAGQTDFFTVARLLQDVVEGKVTADGMEGYLRENTPPKMFARDCSMRWRGVRDARYKYMVRIADDQRFLYDLTADPAETRNVIAKYPDVAEQFESWYWEHENESDGVDIEGCVPTHGN
jgi:arylsulfatase A-like enzyme